MFSRTLLKRAFPALVIVFAICIAAGWIPFLISCSDIGACVSSGGSPEECKQGWSSSECADWDSQQVNGADWIFHAGRECSDLGYSYKCPDGSYVKSSGDC
jgi:hypothetical protein